MFLLSKPNSDKNIVASPQQRIKMLELSLLDNTHQVDSEIERDGISCTYDTIKSFRDDYKENSLYLIMGTDNLKSLHRWYV